MFRSLGFLSKTPQSWPRAATPVVLLVVLSASALWLAMGYLEPLLRGVLHVPAEVATLGDAGSLLLAWIATALAALAGLVVALIVVPPLSAPALEGLVTLREVSLRVAPRPKQSIWFEISCGLRAQALGLALFGPLLFVGWLTNLLVPATAVVVTPITWLCTMGIVAWNLFDYPLTLRGVGARRRLAFLKRHSGTCLGFGAGFALLFWVPCLGILMLPVGVVAATEVVWSLVAEDPEAPPELREALPSGGLGAGSGTALG
jgi:uncharacterized protein involved in cysteine biosynthesis